MKKFEIRYEWRHYHDQPYRIGGYNTEAESEEICLNRFCRDYPSLNYRLVFCREILTQE